MYSYPNNWQWMSLCQNIWAPPLVALMSYSLYHVYGSVVVCYACMTEWRLPCRWKISPQWAGHHRRNKTQTNQAWLLTSREMCSVAFHTQVLFSLCIIETCKKEELGEWLAKQGFNLFAAELFQIFNPYMLKHPNYFPFRQVPMD